MLYYGDTLKRTETPFLARFSVLAYNYTIFTRNALKSKILQK